jgi:hypothetical protein
MIGVGLGVVAKRRYSGFPFALRSFWQRVRDDGGTMQDYNSAISLYRSNNDALLAVSASATKAGKLYSVIPADGSGDFTVTAAKGTRINKNGLIESVATNVPRINWKDGRPYVLREVAATNLLHHNLNFANWSVATGGSVTDSEISSFITGKNWAKLTANNATGIRYRQVAHGRGAFSVTANQLYAAKVAIKKGNQRYIYVRMGGIILVEVIDLDTATIYRTVNPVAKVASKIEDKGDYIYYYVKVQANVILQAPCQVGLMKNKDMAFDSAGDAALEDFDGTEFVLAQGAQFEIDDWTSLVETGATTETRDADIISVALPAGTAKVTTNFITGSPLVDESPTTPYTMPVGEIESVIMED